MRLNIILQGLLAAGFLAAGIIAFVKTLQEKRMYDYLNDYGTIVTGIVLRYVKERMVITDKREYSRPAVRFDWNGSTKILETSSMIKHKDYLPGADVTLQYSEKYPENVIVWQSLPRTRIANYGFTCFTCLVVSAIAVYQLYGVINALLFLSSYSGLL